MQKKSDLKVKTGVTLLKYSYLLKKFNAIQANHTSGLVKKMIAMQKLKILNINILYILFEAKLREAKLATKKLLNTFEKCAIENKGNIEKL